MTHGTIGGIVVTELIHGVEVPWAALYDPSRITPRAARNYVRETSNMAWQYADWVKPGEVDGIEQIAAGKGAIVRRGVHKLAVYRDTAGGVHTMSARCTHLGCVVAWNAAENTWDCKCHGSRFDTAGNVISGPATQPLETVEISPPTEVMPTYPGEERRQRPRV
jgi:Rieske Fe-S protein